MGTDVVNTYQKTTDDGLMEVSELRNGMVIEALIEPSEAYQQALNAQLSGEPPLSEFDIMGRQLVEKDLQILELQQENQTLGQQMVDIDLRLLMGGM